MSPRRISIHYLRLPDRVQVFEQPVLAASHEFVVTFAEAVPISRSVLAAGRTILEPEAPVVWFTYPGRWYDLGRFHLADGTFTGVYANILTPVKMSGDEWHTTDLCLDVWAGTDGRVAILDEEEFASAVERGWIGASTAAVAREHAETLAAGARQGSWPPAHVAEWDLRRARARLRELQTTDRAVRDATPRRPGRGDSPAEPS